jgi:hypothetical protein
VDAVTVGAVGLIKERDALIVGRLLTISISQSGLAEAMVNEVE